MEHFFFYREPKEPYAFSCPLSALYARFLYEPEDYRAVLWHPPLGRTLLEKVDGTIVRFEYLLFKFRIKRAYFIADAIDRLLFGDKL